jgi:hypothetical protein
MSGAGPHVIAFDWLSRRHDNCRGRADDFLSLRPDEREKKIGKKCGQKHSGANRTTFELTTTTPAL